MSEFVPLFPEYLDQGSAGAAVVVLQALFLGSEFEDSDFPIEINGLYADSLIKAIENFQEKHSMGIDGNCGPDTRRAIERRFGVDLNQVPYFSHTKAKFPEGKEFIHPTETVSSKS